MAPPRALAPLSTNIYVLKGQACEDAGLIKTLVITIFTKPHDFQAVC